MAKPTVTQAVQEAYAAIAPALPQLWLEEVPEDSAELQDAYYEHQGEGEYQYATGIPKPTFMVARFSINFFGVSAVAVEANATALKTAFTVEALNLTDNQTTVLKRTNYTLKATKRRDKQNRPIYQTTCSYLVQVGNPL